MAESSATNQVRCSITQRQREVASSSDQCIHQGLRKPNPVNARLQSKNTVTYFQSERWQMSSSRLNNSLISHSLTHLQLKHLKYVMNTQTLLFSLVNLELKAMQDAELKVRHSALNLNDWTDLRGFCANLKSPPMWNHQGSENTSASSGTDYNDASATTAHGLLRASQLLSGILWILRGTDMNCGKWCWQAGNEGVWGTLITGARALPQSCCNCLHIYFLSS